MGKKLNVFMLQLPICYILDQEMSTGANAGIAKTKTREIDCLCFREVNGMLIALAKIPERKGSILPCRFYG